MLERVFDPYHYGVPPLRPHTRLESDVQIYRVPPENANEGDRLTVIFAKETSKLVQELGCLPAEVRNKIR